MSRNTRLAITALLGALTACSDSQEPTPPSRIAGITFVVDSIRIDPGGLYGLVPVARDTSGEVLSGVTYTWRSADPDVATVDENGQVAGIAVGKTTIAASAEGVSGSIIAVVVPSSLGSLELVPAPATLLPGSAVQVVAQFRDTAGRPVFLPALQAADEVLWSSSDSAVVTLRRTENLEGPVRVVAGALKPGEAVITARRGPLSAAATLRIEPESFLAVAAGGAHACAITASHRTYCWGGSSLGELGGGLPDLRCGEFGYCSTVPLLVHGEEHFERLSLGPGHSCGLASGGEPFCWGGGLVNDIRHGSIACRRRSSTRSSNASRSPCASSWQASLQRLSHRGALGVSSTPRVWSDAGVTGGVGALEPLLRPRPAPSIWQVPSESTLAALTRSRSMTLGHSTPWMAPVR